MALPVAKAASLAKDMQKNGLVGSIAMGKPMDEHQEPDGDEPEGMDDLSAVMKDIDMKVPGLGKLIQEMVERCMSKKEEY